MDHRETSRRFGGAVILCALILRLFSAGLIDRAVAFVTQPNITAFLIYLETGQIVRSLPSYQEVIAYYPESPPAAPIVLPEEEKIPETSNPVEIDPGEIAITYGCPLRPDIAALLEAPLYLEVQPDKPTVLILSTHSTESYTRDGESYVESVAYRTLDEGYNMLSLGAYLAETLENAGISVLLDSTVHDYPSYNGAYNHARKAIQSNLESNPSIRLVLDLHRDAVETGKGQLRTAASVDGQESAQLMLVVGTNSSGLQHDQWESNLALALKLQSQLEALAPGIVRPISLRSQRFNQDLSPGALLVEIGAAGNTRQEALLAVDVLAQGIQNILKLP